jgi:hypothetical protein
MFHGYDGTLRSPGQAGHTSSDVAKRGRVAPMSEVLQPVSRTPFSFRYSVRSPMSSSCAAFRRFPRVSFSAASIDAAIT